MTDTTAATGTSAEQAEQESADHAPPDKRSLAEPATPGSKRPAEDQPVVAADQASVPDEADITDKTSSSRPREQQDQSDRPTFTRPPGMTPPPVQLNETGDQLRQTSPAAGVPAGGIRVSPSTSGAYPVVSGTAPVSAPPRSPLRPGGGMTTVRPISPEAAVGAARVGDPAVRPTRAASTPRGPRRARLAVKRIDPWSVMKFSFAVSVVLFIVMIVAASVLYLALDTMGVFASINTTLADLVESGSGADGDTFQITARGVIGTASLLGAINVVLFTALATLGAFIYNVCADLVGGVELTLAERD